MHDDKEMEKLDSTNYDIKEVLFTQTGRVRAWWVIMMNDAIILFCSEERFQVEKKVKVERLRRLRLF
jgi:hypothetical protein